MDTERNAEFLEAIKQRLNPDRLYHSLNVADECRKLAEKYKVSEEEFLSQIGGKDFLKYDLEVRKALEIITK